MGSNLKKIRSLNLNTKLLSVGTILSLGFLGTLLLNNFLEKTYISKKSLIEERIEKFLNKKIDLGGYGGIRFFGISLVNPEVIDKENINSSIKANNMLVSIMPIKSFLNQKWIIKIRPQKTEIKVDRDFFRKGEYNNIKKNINKSKVNYDLNFALPSYSNLRFKGLGLETKIKGNFIYKSKSRQIIGKVQSNFKSEGKENGKLKLNFKTKLNQEFLRFEIFSKGVNLENSKYNFGNRKIDVKNGIFKSNFRFYKSPTETSCVGKFSLNSFILDTSSLAEKINSDSLNFFCKENNLKATTENLNYGTLTSNFDINIPLNKRINNITLIGSIGYLNSLNPDIKLSGEIPYWFDKRGLNFGNINSSFNLNRTQLSNLNVFRNEGLRGFVTARGVLKGEINDPEILINFNIDYPQYKGIRIREIWEGEIKNENNKFLLNMKNRYSPIPSFLSVKFDKNITLENVIFSRIFNSNKGSLKINREDDIYIWNANNFPIDELELDINNNQFDRVSGIINGSGKISSDQTYFEGRLAWSLGKYRNIKFANSLFDFDFKDKDFYINSSLYPIDGGMIEVEYDANQSSIFNVNFKNISTSWSIMTAVDIFNFDNKKEDIKISKSEVLNDLQITNDNLPFKDKVDFINDFLDKNIILEDKFILKKYLSKFDSRYDALLTINGDNPQNYKLKTKLNGYIDVSSDGNENIKEEFSINLEGGLFKGKGSLEINQLPLKAINIFLKSQKDFRGGLDINLLYDLDAKSFLSNISSKNTSIKNNLIIFDKGKIEYDNSIFNIDFSLLLNDSEIPIDIRGSIPINEEDKLDLRLIGNGKFIDLIDILTEDYFTFKKGNANLWMILKGSIKEPIVNGFIVIKDSEVDIYNNIIKDIDSLIIFDFDHVEIKKLKAFGEGIGVIEMQGSLPFYDIGTLSRQEINLKTNKFLVKTENSKFLVDSEIKISGSFENPFLGGNLALNNGYINFKNPNKNNGKKNNRNINKNINKKDWPELFWDKDKNIEIISNETILNSVFLGETLPNYLDNLSFNNLKLKLGPDFRLQYSEIIKAYLDTKLDLNINGNVGKDLNARGLIFLKKGRANLYTTPFKLDKNKDNYILFASRSGVVPFINFSLVSKVPDSIIPISENNQDVNISGDLNADNDSSGFGSFGIGNTRLIKIEASYEGFLDQLSFEDENKRIQLRSTPSYSRSQIIGLIGGNSANLINRAFISQFNSRDAFSERFQLSLYPALIENNNSLNNVFSNEKLEIENDEELTSNEGLSSQAWVAEIGLDVTDKINFAVQTIPGRDDLPPLGILTFQANPNLELLGSFDSKGDWKSQVQLFFRY